MFENSIDQDIDTIRNTSTNTFIKKRKTFCKIWIPPSRKSARKTSNKKVNNFRVIKIMVIHISNSNHRHMTNFINDFLFRQTINIPFINFISRNRKLGLKRSFFKLHIRRSRFWIPNFCKRNGFGVSNKSFNLW